MRCGARGDVVLVGDQHDRAALVVELLEQAEHVGGRRRVEVAGRLVGEDHRRLGDERPGDGDALLLAAGQLAGLVVGPVGEADRVERGQRALAPLGRRARRA